MSSSYFSIVIFDGRLRGSVALAIVLLLLNPVIGKAMIKTAAISNLRITKLYPYVFLISMVIATIHSRFSSEQAETAPEPFARNSCGAGRARTDDDGIMSSGL